ncbi:serine/threonine-protein kinase [Streptomyces sp. NPDC005811]|uniref:serine/threonine-protein kinase n=1 Tax=Streptomyces sp. NPDC005811 TaxID=3154565 RepID=UPI00340B947D
MDPFEALEAGDPREVGRYRIVARLGAGGMGRVYLGRSPGGRAVAVKVVRPELAEDGEFRRRFSREVTAARRVNGVFTAGVVDADPDGSPAWLATAYVPGVPLGDAVSAHGPWPQEQVLALGAGLAEALEAIHAADVVHRDLKPSNILLAEDGPRVIDFGISVAGEGTTLTRTGMVVGTPGFMSPEQLTGKPVGPAGDVFSLGAVLAFTATGAGPFGTGSAHALAFRVVYEDPDLSQLPPTLRTVVAGCLAKRPEQRPTVARLLEQLTDVVDATASQAVPHTPTQPGWLPEPVAIAVHARTTAHHPPAPPPGPLHLPTRPSPRRPENRERSENPESPKNPENPDSAEKQGNPAPASDDDAEPGSGPTPAAGATPAPPAGAAKRRAGPSRRQALFGLGAITAAGLGFLGWKTAQGGTTTEEPDAGTGSRPGSDQSADPSSASSSSPTPSGPAGVERWRFATGYLAYASPTVADGIVYSGSGAPYLYALDTATGEQRWTFTAGADVSSTPAVSGGVVYVGSADGTLHALDAGTGKQRWTFPTGKFGSPSPTAIDGVVYVGGRGEIVYRLGQGARNDYGPGHVYAVDPVTGRRRWTFTTRSSVEASPAAADGMVYTGSVDGTVYAVDAVTGKQRWTFDTGGYVRSSPTVARGVVYIGGVGAYLYALDAATGRQRWKFPLGDGTSSPAVLAGVAYIGGPDGTLCAVDARTGGQLWQFPIGKSVNSPAVGGGTVYVGSEDHNLYAVDAATGRQRWKRSTGGSVYASPTVAAGTVYASSHDGHLYAVWA